MHGKTRKILSLTLSFGLIFQQIGFAQIATELNISGYLSRVGSNLAVEKFRPLHLRYFSYDSLNDNFKVLLDKGDLKDIEGKELQSSTQTLLSYFLVGVTLPDSMFWVNLRPDSEDQIIDQYLGKTDVGRIMLAADLQLKKDTAAMTSPSTPEGREYWDKLYKKAAELYGYDNVTIPTLTRPWIVPGEIIVRESQDSAYIYKATLKVMLEQDYLKDSSTYNFKDSRSKALNEYSSELIRELIISKLTKEVNSSKRYAPLRQVYYSLILSRWFKQRFTGKTGTYASLINSRDLNNLISKESWSKTTYFKEYQKSFSQGEYNIQEPVYTPTGQTIRSYFSGGISWNDPATFNADGVKNPLGSVKFYTRLPSLRSDVIEMQGNSMNGIKASVSSPLGDGWRDRIEADRVWSERRGRALRGGPDYDNEGFNNYLTPSEREARERTKASNFGIDYKDWKNGKRSAGSPIKTPDEKSAASPITDIRKLRTKFDKIQDILKQIGSGNLGVLNMKSEGVDKMMEAKLELGKQIIERIKELNPDIFLNKEDRLSVIESYNDRLWEDINSLISKWFRHSDSEYNNLNLIPNTRKSIASIINTKVEELARILNVIERAIQSDNTGFGKQLERSAALPLNNHGTASSAIKAQTSEEKIRELFKNSNTEVLDILQDLERLHWGFMLKFGSKLPNFLNDSIYNDLLNSLGLNPHKPLSSQIVFQYSSSTDLRTAIKKIELLHTFFQDKFKIIGNFVENNEKYVNGLPFAEQQIFTQTFIAVAEGVTKLNKIKKDLDGISAASPISASSAVRRKAATISLVERGKSYAADASTYYKDDNFEAYYANLNLADAIARTLEKIDPPSAYAIYLLLAEIGHSEAISKARQGAERLSGKIPYSAKEIYRVIIDKSPRNLNTNHVIAQVRVNLEGLKKRLETSSSSPFSIGGIKNNLDTVKKHYPDLDKLAGIIYLEVVREVAVNNKTKFSLYSKYYSNGGLPFLRITITKKDNGSLDASFDSNPGLPDNNDIKINLDTFTIAGLPESSLQLINKFTDLIKYLAEYGYVSLQMSKAALAIEFKPSLSEEERKNASRILEEAQELITGVSSLMQNEEKGTIHFQQGTPAGKIREALLRQIDPNKISASSAVSTDIDALAKRLAEIGIRDDGLGPDEAAGRVENELLGLGYNPDTTKRIGQATFKLHREYIASSLAPMDVRISRAAEEFKRLLLTESASSPVVESKSTDLTAMPEEEVRRLIGLLVSQEEYSSAKIEVTNTLKSIKDEKNIGILKEELLKNSSYSLRISIAQILGAIGNEYSVDALMEAITTRSFEKGLSPFQGKEREWYRSEETGRLVQKIIPGSAIDDRPASVLFWIISSLGETKSKKPIDLLIKISSGGSIYTYNLPPYYKSLGFTTSDRSVMYSAKRAVDEINNAPAASSAIDEPSKTPGGIDFRALPMTIQPMGSFVGLNFKLPQLTQAELAKMNIDSEMQQIQNMVASGILPSGQRVKELIAACAQKKEIGARADNLLLCLIDICKLEEENAYEASPELREALVIVDSIS